MHRRTVVGPGIGQARRSSSQRAQAYGGLLLSWLWLAIWSCSAQSAERTPVRISEIFYHPASEDSREEFVELWNLGATNVSLKDWRFTGGLPSPLPLS